MSAARSRCARGEVVLAGERAGGDRYTSLLRDWPRGIGYVLKRRSGDSSCQPVESHDAASCQIAERAGAWSIMPVSVPLASQAISDLSARIVASMLRRGG